MHICIRLSIFVLLLATLSSFNKSLESHKKASLYGTQTEPTGTEIILAYNLEFSVEDIFEAEVNGPLPCIDHHQIKVMGSVELNNASLILNGGFENTVSDEILLIDNDGNDLIVGTFLNLQEEAYIEFGEFVGIISYIGGDGNDVVLKAIPEDNEAPTIVCVEDIILETDEGSCLTTFDLPVFEVNDNISTVENITITRTRSDAESIENSYPIGETTISYQAVDEAGNESEICELIVLVEDKEIPEMVCPANISIESIDGSPINIADVGLAKATDNCTDTLSISSSVAATGEAVPEFFPVGTTIIQWSTIDDAGNAALCNQSVTVTFTPSSENSITAFTLSNQIGQTKINGTSIEIEMPIGSDLTNLVPSSLAFSTDATISPAVSDVQDFSSPVDYTVTAQDNSTRTFTVFVTVEEDTTDPEITCIEDIVVRNNDGECGAVVNYTAPVGTDDQPGATTTLITGLASGETFSLGETIVTYEVVDASGNNAQCSFTVTVDDDEAPEISCPDSISIRSSTGLILQIDQPIVSDNCTAEPTITYVRSDDPNLSIEDEFQMGTTIITWTVIDANGNQNTCDQLIEITRELFTQNDITSIEIPNQIGDSEINQTELTITMVVPFGSDVTTITPTFEVSEEATVLPESGIPNDFTNPVEYVVTAEDSSVKIWTIEVVEIACDDFQLSIENIQNPSTCFGADGSVQILETGGLLPITYSWVHDESLSSNQLTNLSAGSYKVMATDAGNCTTELNFELVDPELPEVSLAPFQTVRQNYSSFTLSGGLPLGGVYSGLGVTNGSFDPAIGVGSYEIIYTFTDPETNCENSITKNITVLQEEILTATKNAIDATYLQGSSNLEPLGPILRAEQGRRIVYMKFDLSSINGTISEAKLQLQVASDPGTGTLEIFLGNHTDWTETSLNFTNKPVASGVALSTISGTHSLGQNKIWNLDASRISEGDFMTLILVHSNGNDVAFASDETPQSPKLTITSISTNQPADVDGDGFNDDVDCDDNNPLINPDAEEICDGIDNNCDGLIDNQDLNVICDTTVDLDGDGFNDDVDCDDNNPLINPDAEEICDGIDNNCDGLIDDQDPNVICDTTVDLDGDGFNDDVDCDDNNPLINPDAEEICDGIDNNCDGLVDDQDPNVICDTTVDLDGDGFNDDVDCDDNNPLVNPDAEEICDGIDNNCDGLIDDQDPNLSCGPLDVEVDLVDATYLQGASNIEPLGPILRAEQGRRVVYMKFDLSTINGSITNAELQLQVASDPGYGTLEIYLGNHADWTETNLSFTNRPVPVGTALATISGTHGLGKNKIWSLDASRLPNYGFITLILTHSNGNDVAFASDETLQAPKLTITSEAIVSNPTSTFLRRETSLLPLSPNPAVLETTIRPTKPTELVDIYVYDEIGRLVKTYQGPAIKSNGSYTLDIRELAEGVYYIRSIDANGNEHYEMMMVKK